MSGDGDGWRVAIVDPRGREVSARRCRDEAEALVFASTVLQHVRWLSEPRFREYYRLPDPASRSEAMGPHEKEA